MTFRNKLGDTSVNEYQSLTSLLRLGNLDGLLDEYYEALGYTRKGVPSAERLEQLGLGWVKLDQVEVEK